MAALDNTISNLQGEIKNLKEHLNQYWTTSNITKNTTKNRDYKPHLI